MNDKQGPVKDAIRWVFGWIDWIFYVVLGWVFQVFFDITTVELLTGETIRNFCSRIQLILGVFMVFKISISILQAIVDPEKISDKNNGFSAYIKRIVICLIMLTVLIPRHIPNAKTEYEIQINNNGLLFGTLYSLQGRIMKNNTLGKLVLGSSNDVISTSDSTEEQVKKMNDLGTEFTSTIIRSFLKETSNCSGEADGDGVKILKDENADAKAILNNHINETCGSLTKGYYYAIEYYPLIGGVVALAFIIIIVGFSIDIAVRSIKIAVLRLIAPIPIISYLDPNQEKKGAFANWVKTLVSTYLDLFIRLALIYFVIFLIGDIMANGLAGYNGNDGNGPFVFIIICIGLFYFAKQAPKFIKSVLGVQGSLSNIGLASIMGTAGTLAVGGGIAKGFSNGLSAGLGNAQSSTDSLISGKPGPSFMENYAKYRDGTLQQITGDKNRHGGAMGWLDHVTDKAMAKRYGLDEANIKAAKNYTKAEEGKLSVIAHDLEEEKSRRDGLFAQNTTGKLSQYVNSDGSWISEDARNLAYKYDRETANTHDRYLESDKKAKALYNAYVEQADRVENYKKNTEDMKDAAKTFYGKDKPYTPQSPATPRPDPGHESKAGSGGTIFSSAGVNSNFDGPGPGGHH